MRRRLGFSTVLALGSLVPAWGSLIYTCDPSIGAATCAAVNGSSVSGIYSGIFSSSMSANIYLSYGGAGIGSSSTELTGIAYATYFSALAAHTDNPVALASLGVSGDPLGAQSDGSVLVSAALANSLGITEHGANTAGLMADGMTQCILGSAGCYNGVITIAAGGGFYFPASPTDPPPPHPPDNIDFYYIVEHETDEVLGTISCIGTDNMGGPSDQCNPGFTDASPADLFRYSAPGVRTFLSTANGTPAYFSNNGGATDIADYTNTPGLGDYGDWLTQYPGLVQDGEGSPDVTLDISTDVGVNANHYPQPEVAVLNAIGFNLQSTPEPATFSLVALGLLALGFAGARRRA